MARPIDFYFRAPAPKSSQTKRLQLPQVVSEPPQILQLPPGSKEEEETTDEFIRRIVPREDREELWAPVLSDSDYDFLLNWLENGHRPYISLVLKGVTCERAFNDIVRKYPWVVNIPLWELFFPLFFAAAEEEVIRESLKPDPKFSDAVIRLALPYAKRGTHIKVAYVFISMEENIKKMNKARISRFLRGTYAYVKAADGNRPMPEGLLAFFPETSS
jgi:hypothetical protein